MTRRPPRLAAALLELLVPLDQRESIPGDLAEEYISENRSNLWYWRQVMQSSGYWAGQSMGKSGLGILVGAAAWGAGILAITLSVRAFLPILPRIQPLEFAFTLTLLAIGLAFSIAGGYLATRLAGVGGKPVPVILGLLHLVITAAWLLRGVGAAAPIWFQSGLILLVVPAAQFGRHLRREQLQTS